jgi:hypothetical protein
MRRQPYPVAKITGGLDVSIDPVFLVDKSSPNLQCARIQKGLIKKDLDFVNLGSTLPLDGSIMLIDSFTLYDGSRHHLFVTTDWVYRLSSSEVYSKKNSANQFTGGLDDRFVSTAILDSDGSDMYLLTNGKDPIVRWGGGSGNFTIFGGGTSYYAKAIGTFQNRIILGNTVEGGQVCPKRIRWSAPGAPEDFTSTGSGFVDLVDTPDNIVALVALKGRFFIIKEGSIWEMLYVGGDRYFDFVIRVSDVGGVAPNAISSTKERLMLLGDNDIYTFDTYFAKPIGEQIRSLLFNLESSIMNTSVANRCCSAYIKDLNEFWLVVPTEGGVPNKLFKHDIANQCWIPRDKEVTAIGFYRAPVGAEDLSWADNVGTWLEDTEMWLLVTVATGSVTTLIGTDAGYIKEDNRATKSSDTFIFETKDWFFAHAERWIAFNIQAKGGPFYVSYSIDGGVTWSGAKLFAVSTKFTEYTLPLNLTSQHIRCKIETTAQDFDLKWIDPWYIPRARSKELVVAT